MMATVFLHLDSDDPVAVNTLSPGSPCVSVSVAWLQCFVQPQSANTARRFAEALIQAADQMEATVTPASVLDSAEGDLETENAHV